MAIEVIVHRLDGLDERALKPAGGRYAARPRIVRQAFDYRARPFARANDVPYPQRLRRARQPQAASLSPHRLDDAAARELMNDLHQVVLGYAVSAGDLGNGAAPLGVEGQIHEHAERVVRKGS